MAAKPPDLSAALSNFISSENLLNALSLIIQVISVKLYLPQYDALECATSGFLPAGLCAALCALSVLVPWIFLIHFCNRS